jgi:hypothetical protein
VARRRAILDRCCARRPIARAGRDGRMVPIEQKDWTEEDSQKLAKITHTIPRRGRFSNYLANPIIHFTISRSGKPSDPRAHGFNTF